MALTILPSCDRKSSGDGVSGTIQVDEVRVGSRYGGRVEQISAREGDTLAPNEVFIQLEAAELHARKAETSALLAELEAGPRPQEIAAARAAWESLAAELELARTNALRAEDLFSRQTISITERDQAVTRARALEKSAAAAQSQHELLLAGTRPEQLARIRAQLDLVESQLAETEIRSPTNAILEVLGVKVGDVLAPNQPAATLILTDHLWIRVYVPQTWLGRIQLHDRVEVRADTFPDRVFQGEVEQIHREAEFTPRNVQTVGERIKQVFGVKVRLENSTGELRAGMSAEVLFPGIRE